MSKDLLSIIKNRLNPLRMKVLLVRAGRHRSKLKHVNFVGITGSAGKTTTKELTAAILARFGPCRKTEASYNMTTDVIYAVLNTKDVHHYCVAEIGAYGPGTMDVPLQVFQPSIAVVTLIGKDHISAYKQMDKLVAEKEKMIAALASDGTAVLNMDDPAVRGIGHRCDKRIIWFGRDPDATLRLLEASSRWPDPLCLSFRYQGTTYEVRTQLHGTHMTTAVLASLGVALAAGLPLQQAIEVISQQKPSEGRMQPVASDDGVVFIRDDIKAPYWSLDVALAFMKNARAERKIAILGTISDSSSDDAKKYKKVCRQARTLVDQVIFIGPSAHRALRARTDENDRSIQGFPNPHAAWLYLQSELRKGDLVLLKGSNRADHLVRLLLHREKPICCWANRCSIDIFCDHCPRLYSRSRWISVLTPLILRMRSRDTDAQRARLG